MKNSSSKSNIIIYLFIFMCLTTHQVYSQVLIDSLNLKSKGQVIGGEFQSGGGWAPTNWNDLIKYDLKKYYSKGRLVINLQNFNPALQNTSQRHHIISMYSDMLGDHNHWSYNIGDTTSLGDPTHWSYTTTDSVEKSVWNLHTGTNYRGGFKFLSISGKKIQTYLYDQIWDQNKTYQFMVTWDKNRVNFYIDSVLIIQNEHWQNVNLRYLFLGRDLTHSLDYSTGLPGNQYPPQPDVIYSNLNIYGDSTSNEILPSELIEYKINLPDTSESPDTIYSFDIDIKYNSDLLTVNSIEKNSNEPSLNLFFSDSPNIIRISAFSINPINQRDEIVNIRFLPLPDSTDVRIAHIKEDRFFVNLTELPISYKSYIIHPLDSLSTVPVELSNFQISVIDKNSVLLKWQTESEKNNFGFEIQQADLNHGFKKIGFKKGFGTSSIKHEYEFLDTNLENGKYTYRLKQVDMDGSFIYSIQNTISIGLPEKFCLLPNYPNPFYDHTILPFQIPNKMQNEEIKFEIYNLQGRLVKSAKKMKDKIGYFTWDGTNQHGIKVPAGVYFVVLQIKDLKTQRKILLIK